jgi:hypothetical protein
MRLIDADALRASAIKTTGNTELAFDNCFPYWQFSKCIKEAPTINAVPVVRGEWEYEHGAWACSKCGEDNPYGIDYETVAFSKYCPNCGAKMEDKPCG